jgi:CheY-like chemotaxis protein
MHDDKTKSGLAALRALLVEDNEHMRALLRTLLRSSGIRQIVEHTDGSAALADLHITKPDIIFIDLLMTPMDGITFTQQLRQSKNEHERVLPVIVVSGHTERRRVEAARDAGATEILTKPITAAALFDRIEKVIFRPRPFVRSPAYFGPCRRRRHNDGYMGPWRRQSDLDEAPVLTDVTTPRSAPARHSHSVP